MKKLPLLIICLALAAIVLAGCAAPSPTVPEATEAPFSVKDAEIFASAHQREEAFSSYFKTHALETPFFTVHMDDGIYEESALRAAAEKLLADVEKASAYTGAEPCAFSVYIREKLLPGNPSAAGSGVFIAADELDTGAYRRALLKVGFGLKAEWQSVGLSGCVFGGAPDETGLGEYYSDPENVLTASCSPLFLEPAVAGEETAAAAERTAQSIAAFIIDGEGFEAFRGAADTAGFVEAWFSHIGAEGGSLPAGSDKASGIELKMDKYYLCVISADNYTIKVDRDSAIRSAPELYSFVCGLCAGCSELREKLVSELPSFEALIDERMNEDITIELTDDSSSCYSYPTRNQIFLWQPGPLYHEMVHLILEPYNYVHENDWIAEAIAEYFSNDVMDKYAPTDYICGGEGQLFALFEEVSGKEAEEGDVVFLKSLFALYNELDGKKDPERDNTMAFELSHGICSMLLDGVERTQMRMKYDRTVAYGYGETSGPKEEEGNGMSYPQSLAVFLYLCENKGLEKTVHDYLYGISVTEIAGVPYPELYSAAKAYYNDAYGKYMHTGE